MVGVELADACGPNGRRVRDDGGRVGCGHESQASRQDDLAGPSSGYSAAVSVRKTRRWRDYRTATGGRPVKDFLDALTDEEVAAVVADMKDISRRGLPAAKHLHGDVYEVRTDAATRSFRVLFASEGLRGQVLLSLSAFVKKTQRTPLRELALADNRLRDWRARGASLRRARGRG